MSEGHLPSMTDRGSDAHQIRRLIERAYSEIDNASLRAGRAQFPDLRVALVEVLGRLDCIRTAAEGERRKHTPERFRVVGQQRDQQAQQPQPQPEANP